MNTPQETRSLSRETVDRDTSPEGKTIILLTPEQRKVFTQSAARLEIVDAMFELAPCSVAELARELRRSPQSLYYHIDLMLEVGLIIRAGARRSGRRDEALYKPAAEHFRLVNNQSPDHRSTLLRFNKTVLKLTERNYRNALSRRLTRRIGDGARYENIYTRLQRGWLTDDDLISIYDHINAIGEIMQRANRAKKGQPYSLTMTLSPVAPSSAAAGLPQTRDGHISRAASNRPKPHNQHRTRS